LLSYFVERKVIWKQTDTKMWSFFFFSSMAYDSVGIKLQIKRPDADMGDKVEDINCP